MLQIRSLRQFKSFNLSSYLGRSVLRVSRRPVSYLCASEDSLSVLLYLLHTLQSAASPLLSDTRHTALMRRHFTGHHDSWDTRSVIICLICQRGNQNKELCPLGVFCSVLLGSKTQDFESDVGRNQLSQEGTVGGTPRPKGKKVWS